jgi:hypothetical protein
MNNLIHFVIYLRHKSCDTSRAIMSSPNPAQQYRYPGPGQQAIPAPQQFEYRLSEAYPAHHDQIPVKYSQPPENVPPTFIAELPGSIPSGAPVALALPALRTSTSRQQLTEDGQLAQKLQQMEVQDAHARARSNSNVSQRLSMVATNESLHNPASQAYQQEQLTRPHSMSFSSSKPYSSNLSPHPSPSLLPEVVVGPHTGPAPVLPQFMPSTLPEVVIGTPQPYFAPSPQLQQAQFPPALPDPAALSAYLEKNRQVPYPAQWILPSVTTTLYSSFEYAPKSDFLDTLESQIWRSTRISKTPRNAPSPSFKFKFKNKGGSFTDPKYSWTMTPLSATPATAKYQEWTYQITRERRTGMRKFEGLAPPKSKMQILTTYVPAINYDSLRFHGPDGKNYMWVTQTPLSSAQGTRYDTLRHALFVSDQRSGISDPLYGRIVADHTYWDGFIDETGVHAGTRCSGCSAAPINGLRWKCKTCKDHDICETCRASSASVNSACRFTMVSLPDEALYIRDPSVDIPMVVASLQVLKDWEMHTLRRQKSRDPRGFLSNVEEMRKGDLGRVRFWRSTDFEARKGEELNGALLKLRECMNWIDEPVVIKDGGASGEVRKERAVIS